MCVNDNHRSIRHRLSHLHRDIKILFNSYELELIINRRFIFLIVDDILCK